VTDTLAVEINRTGLHSLEAPASFETDGSFDVELRNRGESTHVHLHLDDALSSVARLGATNHYVRGNGVREVRVDVDAPEGTSQEGSLKVVVAHGAQTRYVTVTVDTTTNEVRVDPELAQPSDPEPEGVLAGADPLTVSALGLGLVGVILALGAVFAADGINIILAVLALLAGLIAGGLATLR
jgi:hypothetical protein